MHWVGLVHGGGGDTLDDMVGRIIQGEARQAEQKIGQGRAE